MSIFKAILEEINRIVFWFLELRSSAVTEQNQYPNQHSRSGINVRPSATPYHQEKGWKDRGNVIEGWYRCRYGAWQGKVERTPSGKLKFYIIKPPEELKQHSHWKCFHYTGEGEEYFIHFSKDHHSLDGGIMAVQRILNESFDRR